MKIKSPRHPLNMLFGILMIPFSSVGQNANLPVDPKLLMESITATTPDVATLGRFTMQPPNYSNGLPQQTIPLFEIKENGITYPVSLFYNASGFRVKEEASSVGLGWGLTEGMIIRVVKHIPDEHMNLLKKFEDFGENPEGESDYGLVLEGLYCNEIFTDVPFNLTANRIFYKLYDAQPDLYIYNFGQYTGKFLWIGDKAINLEHNDLVIKRVPDGAGVYYFTITTPEGVVYRFNEGDKTWYGGVGVASSTVYPPVCMYEDPIMSYSDYGYVTTWRLAEVENKATKAKFNFSYYSNITSQGKNNNQTTSISLVAPYVQYLPGEVHFYPENVYFITDFKKDDVYTQTNHQTLFTKEIDSDHYKVTVSVLPRSDGGEYRLNEIKVFNKLDLANPIKTIRFTHGYFGDITSNQTCWLKLKEVAIEGSGTNARYNFSYINESYQASPQTLSKQALSIDHWGYFNGIVNQSLVPLLPEIQTMIENESNLQQAPIPWGNRNVDSFYAKLFMLETVLYPTGGFTKYEYESAGGRGVRVKSLEDFDGYKSTLHYYDYGTAYTIPPFYEKQEYYTHQCGDNPSDFPYNSRITVCSSHTYGALDFFQESENFYGEVTEYIGTPDGQGGKNVYNYIKLYGASNKELLTGKSSYAYNNPVAISSETYHYNAPVTKMVNYWMIPELQGIGVPGLVRSGSKTGEITCCPTDPLNNFHYILGDFGVDAGGGGIQSVNAVWIRLEGTETTRDGVTATKNIFYKDPDPVTGIPAHSNPVYTEENLSDGRIKRTEYYYPGEADPDNSNNTLGIAEMWDNSNPQFKNVTGPVVKVKTFIDNSIISKEVNHYSYDAANNLLVRSGYDAIPTGNDTGKQSWNFAYDNKANLIKVTRENDITSAFVWGYNDLLPIVKAENVDRTVLGAAVSAATSNLNQLLVDIGDMSTETQKQLWRDFNTQLKNNLPAGTPFVTYTYKPQWGITSTTDLNGVAVYYLYDEFGRLKMIKDNDGKIVKTYQYHYKE